MPLVTGATAAGFSIVRPLGSGQHGEVYLAERPRLPRRHALKILPADVSADPVYQERFYRESDLAAALWHPNIVGLYDRGEFEGRLWLLMDYVDGADATQLLSDAYPDGVPPDEVLEIVTAVAEALDYAHDRGLVHGYVKPGNILLTKPESGNRRILLADFGVPRQTDMTVGAVSYAAPEQLMDDSVDGRADQYALACTAFHLLTGSPPFAHHNPAVVISKHLNESPPRPGDVKPELGYLDEAFTRALAKAPVDRFARCRDFAAALQENHRIRSDLSDAEATTVLGSPAENAMTEPVETDHVVAEPPDVWHNAEFDEATTFPEPALSDAIADEADEDSAASPDVWEDTEFDDAAPFFEPAVSRATTAADTSATARRRRLLQTGAFALTIVAVALLGYFAVMLLRSRSFQDTPTVETPAPVTTIRPAAPPPPRATPPPTAAPVPAPPLPPEVSAPPSPAATTTTPPTSMSTPSETHAAPTTTTRSSSAPPPLDTRPALGMPCSAAQTGTATVSNTGVPISCVDTPGGFAWEPSGG
ncbi:serine/threonine-protein kinase [Mycobacterium kyorinense]|uniref:serine/threonine-protein kinase n=1 Tax=Mycobacterium kyorinense TaxID=487514 RepID=UPI00084CDBCA|nr:serine/threonine-protein kinase [Mycobacterium kyorinense]